MIVLINYANDIYRRTQRLNSWTGMNIAKFDKVIEYSNFDIDDEFRLMNNKILNIRRGNGLWLWKPYIIKKTLEKLHDGDIVFYCDSGSFFIRDIKHIIKSMNNQDIWVSDLPLIEKQFTKKKTFELMDCENSKYYESNQIQGGFLAFRKNINTLKFVTEWLELCSNIDILGINENEKHNTDLIAHREDQSVLSLLCKKKNIVSHLDPTQYGKLPEKYITSKRIIFKIPLHKDNYKPIIILHRTHNVNIIVCIKQLLCILLPRKIAIRLIAK